MSSPLYDPSSHLSLSSSGSALPIFSPGGSAEVGHGDPEVVRRLGKQTWRGGGGGNSARRYRLPRCHLPCSPIPSHSRWPWTARRSTTRRGATVSLNAISLARRRGTSSTLPGIETEPEVGKGNRRGTKERWGNDFVGRTTTTGGEAVAESERNCAACFASSFPTRGFPCEILPHTLG